MKSLVSCVLIVLIVMLCLPQVAYANSPGPSIDGSYDTSPALVIGIVIIYCLVVGFTCLVEWLVSIPFKMHKECARIIIVTNILTQIGMHLLEFGYLAAAAVPAAFWVGLPLFIVMLEVIVYATEFFVYYKKMLGFPTWQILLYTILANTTSLILGLLIIF